MVFLSVLVGAVLWDRWIGFVQADGTGVPVLNPDTWPILVFLPLLIAAEIAFAIALHRTDQWTRALAFVNAALAVVATTVGVILLASRTLLNEAFFTAVAPDDADAVRQVTVIIIGIVMIVIAGWDVLDGMLKTRRHTRDAGTTGA